LTAVGAIATGAAIGAAVYFTYGKQGAFGPWDRGVGSAEQSKVHDCDDYDWENDGADECDDEDLWEAFEGACTFVLTGSSLFGQEELLLLYGLYKQATEGDCPAASLTQKLSLFLNQKEWKKKSAWMQNRGLSKSDAMDQYAGFVMHKAQQQAGMSFSEPGQDADAKRDTSSASAWGKECSSTLRDAYGEFDDDDSNDCVSVEELEPDVVARSTWYNFVMDGDLKSVSECEVADVNERDTKERVALHWASDRGSLDMVEYLLALGADPNAPDHEGQTPLHYAAICEHRDIYAALVAAGGDVTRKDSSGESPQEWAEQEWLPAQ